MAFSAAELQRRHELEGAPDPFPSLSTATPVKAKNQRPATLDTDSEIAFPSLTPSTASNAPAVSAWSTAGPRLKAAGPKTPVFTDSFTLTAIDLSSSGKDGKPASLGEVLKQVMVKYKVKIEASANAKSRQHTFHMKSESQKELDKAKRSLVALLSPVITLTIQAPASTIGSIVGPKGANLKQIRDLTSVRVDIPKREVASTPTGNGHANGSANGNGTHDDDEEEPTVPVTLTGPQSLAYEAQAMLKQIIASRTSRSTQRVRDIPTHILPFVLARKAQFLAAAEYGIVDLTLKAPIREITASGDREAVGQVVEAIKHAITDLETTLTSVKISLPKRQHRLLTGPNAEAILKEAKCAIVVANPEEGDEVTVWGTAGDLPNGLSAVMTKANSKYIHEMPLPGPIAVSKQFAAYFARIQYAKTLSANHPAVETFLPSPDTKANTLSIDFLGEKKDVDGAIKQVSDLLGKLIGATKDVQVDWLLHRIIQGKNAKKIKQYHETSNVLVYFAAESLEQSQVLLVHDPLTSAATVSPDEKKKRLDAVEKDLLKLAHEAGDVKTEEIDVDKRWHEAILGNGRTTLNAIIGEDTTLSIKVGAEAAKGTEDIVVVRGIRTEVDRAVKDIIKIVEDAKNDEIVSSYFTEFDIEKEYVGRIVGAQGSGVNKLRDQLGVKVDITDEVEDKEKESAKKKKAVHAAKARVKVTGRKENVEEAKKRILAQIERLADETQEVLKIPVQYHASLIGTNGKYAIRLEEKYAVKITFPRQHADPEGKGRDQLKADEVLVKGGRKGVAGAKSELMDALEFEKEHNNSIKFNIPTRSVARVLGRAGASINEIKDDTGAQIDVEKGSEDGGNTTVITLRGTKKAINEAKARILEISNQAAAEITESITIENRFHRSIIGGGGQGLKDLIAKCDGPSDPKLQAGLVRFPRQGDPSDEVTLRGEPKLVAKLKGELEKIAAELRDRIVLGIVVPSAQHRVIIGRGGQHLNELQNKFNVQIQFPGSRSYGHVSEPANQDELSDANPADIVKVSGSRAACDKAISELKSNVRGSPSDVTSTMSVPLKYHHAISNQGIFFRTLRNFGVSVDHSAQPTKTAVPSRPISNARIDEDPSSEPEWEVVPNYQDADEGESTWTIKARDQAGLEKAEKLIQEAIDAAAEMSHVGFLTMPDRSTFPRIVGSKGANVARLRNETGADINVSRENTTIVIIGTEHNILAAKDSILRMSSSDGRSRRYD